MNMNNNNNTQDEDEEEYEYEYSTTETEDFYFTLDLTTHVPGALAPQPPARSGNGIDPVADVNGDGNPGDDAEQNNSSTNNPPTDKTTSSTPSDTLQILDLHTPNPLLKFNNETFTAHWSTDLGTQFHITQTGLHPTPLRRGNVLDVVALSQTRLLAKPITLNPRSHPHGPALNPSTTAKLPARKIVPVVPTTGLNDHHSSSDEEEPSRKSSTPGGPSSTPQSSQIIARPGLPLYIPPSYRSSPSAATQASFLTRLSTIKLQKGETDLVPVYAVKIYNPPPDAASLRASALAADEAAGHDVTVARMLDRSTGSRVDDGTGRREMRRQREGTLQEAKRRVRGKGTRTKKERVGEGGEVVGFGMGRGAGRASRERIRREVGFEEDGDVVRRDGMGRVERVHSGFRMRDGEQVLGLQREDSRGSGVGDVEMVEVDDEDEDDDGDGDGDEDVEMGEEEERGGGSSARVGIGET
ncbi:unnamed protein product [Zymoseptoria tritici ST99CH_3D7]|uniref:Transcription factor TFIIIC triple barrel domain-containing protein n=1 Tax=Zymoseptoria tritici (strain ST99CH_3D7) TaxID=1276538 RepID=A0A1X7RX77_ZYMT9|nr:unnamed protein product [Zymoseptoria tritici ST99CH_3D7]